jgi:cystathionine beta-lyase
VDPRHVRFTNGVVAAVGVTIAAFTEPGEAVIVFPPVYHAFYRHIRDLGRDVRECELSVEEGRHTFDLEAFGATLRGDERILIFCNPHNPGGRIWSPDEVREIAAFCERHDLILVADEIHMDLCFPGTRHVVTALAAPEALPRLVVLTAASKGFNTAGGETGFAIIPDTDLRNTWSEKLGGYGGQPSRLGLIATEAAFRHGDEWSDALRAYLAENFRLWRDRIDAIPGVSVMDMNATYLSWVDFRGTGLDDKELGRRVVTEARIAPSPGTAFGSGGAGHLRFNLALPRPTLLDAIGRIEAAFADLQ